jgi:hypothetical protein
MDRLVWSINLNPGEWLMKNVSGDELTVHKQELVKDLLFLDAWEKGFVPWSRAASVVFRVRQLRRSNPTLQDLKRTFDNKSLLAEANCRRRNRWQWWSPAYHVENALTFVIDYLRYISDMKFGKRIFCVERCFAAFLWR